MTQQNRNTDGLKSFKDMTAEEQKAIASKGGKASVEAKRHKKMMSQIYADFLIKEHDIIGKDGLKRKFTGDELLSNVMSKVLARGDAAAVSLMKEIREATEGTKINFNDVSEGRLKLVDYMSAEDVDSVAKQIDITGKNKS